MGFRFLGVGRIPRGVQCFLVFCFVLFRFWKDDLKEVWLDQEHFFMPQLMASALQICSVNVN